tara:strand:+ start:7434 stop:7919 length:486 start_codon:yes stop_codon:yes gene_type:complete
MNLSPHFTLAEAMASHAAVRLGIDNTPPDELIAALRYVAINVLEPIRTHYGVPLVYDGRNSWYRCPALNAALPGAAANSQHVKGEAVDIEVPGISNIELARFVRDHLKFDELGLENYDSREGPQSGWVHVGASAGFRGQRDIWTYDARRPNGQRYTPGLAS